MPEPSVWANSTVSAITGAVAGGLISFFVALFSAASNRHSMAVSDLLSLTEDFAIEACAYWRTTGQNKAVESRMKSQLERIDMRMQSVIKKGKAKRNKDALISKIDDLTEASTGGAFEEMSRYTNVARVKKIRSVIKEIDDLVH